MQKSILYIGGGIVIVSIIIIGLILFGGQKQKKVSNNNKKISVVATIYPLYDIVKTVAGENAEVDLLLPPGASPHFFEFTPKQMQSLKNTDIAFVIGHGADDWAKDALTANDIPIITVDKNIILLNKNHKPKNSDNNPKDVDPHYWLSLNNAILIAQTVAETLSENDPDNSPVYQNNAQVFANDLRQTDKELRQKIDSLDCRDMIVLHGAWYYFARHFDLNIVGVFMPESGQTPSPQYISDLSSALEASCSNVIFTEPQLSTDLLQAFANEHGTKVATLDPIGGEGKIKTYKDLMVYNINVIIDALK